MIEGVTVVDLRQIVDDRGAVLHMCRSDAPDFTRFGECYFSEVRPGVVKAFTLDPRLEQGLAAKVHRSASEVASLNSDDLGRPRFIPEVP